MFGVAHVHMHMHSGGHAVCAPQASFVDFTCMCMRTKIHMALYSPSSEFAEII